MTTDDLRYPGTWSLDSRTIAVLQLYVERLHEFSELGRIPYPAESTIRVDQDGLSTTAELPDEVMLRSASMCARHFLLKKEATYFPRVCNLLYRCTQETRFHREIASVRESLQELLAEELNPSTGHQRIKTQSDLINAYFNGYFFHADGPSRDFVRVDKIGFGPLLKQKFAQCIHRIYYVALRLGRVVDNALGVDQLAPCAVSKRIQCLLDTNGMAPTAISIHPTGNHAYRPPIQGVGCRLDKGIPDECKIQVANEILTILCEEFPKLEYYTISFPDPTVGIAILSIDRPHDGRAPQWVAGVE